MPNARYEVHFRGRVQGVGFRWTVLRVANHFDVVGYVKNLLDGQVELVAEGDQEELDRFVAAIEAPMHGYIAGTSVTKTAPMGQFDQFQIRY